MPAALLIFDGRGSLLETRSLRICRTVSSGFDGGLQVVMTHVSFACKTMAPTPPKAAAPLCLLSISLSGCSGNGAPSFELFGAFFPAWLFCGVIGVAGAGIARAAFVGSGLANVLPYQLTVCTAVGVIAAVLVWLVGFGQ